MTRSRSRTRIALSLGDAAVSSLGNLGLTWAGARFLDLRDFGVLSSLMLASLIFAGIAKAFLVDPFTLSSATEERAEADGSIRRVFGGVVVAALLVSLAILVIGGALVTAFGATYSWVVLLGAIGIPIICQDGFRWLCYAMGAIPHALLSTVIWTLGTWAGIGVLVLTGSDSLGTFVLAWGGTAGLGAVVAVANTAAWPDLGAARTWWRTARSVGTKSSLDFVLTQSVSMGSGLVIAAAAGPSALGLIRLAQLPLAPLQVITTGSLGFLQPTMVVRVKNGRSWSALRLGLATLLILAVLAVVVGLGVLVVPEFLMSALLGSSWPEARLVVLPVTLTAIGSAVAACTGPYLRAEGLLGFEVRWKSIAGPMALLVVLVAAVGAGALGGASGQALGTLLFAGPIAWKAIAVGRGARGGLA